MDTDKYIQVMQTIKGRKDHIDWIRVNAGAMGKVSSFMVESTCLQLRMMIEDLAVACVIVNADEMPDLARRLRGEYRPKLVLQGLEQINPECYPIPIIDNVEGSRGNFRDTTTRPEGDWLTRDEAVEEYGRLSSFVHRNLKAYVGNPVDYLELYKKCAYIEYKIRNLLSHHHITAVNENTMYRVLMSATGVDARGALVEGQVQVVEFTRVPKNLEKAVLEGEMNVDDIVAGRTSVS